jgi:biotin synthase-related radical SAM superfamily protein
MNFREQPEIKKVLILDTDDLQAVPREIEVPVFQRIEMISGTLKELEKKIKELQKSGESVWVRAVNTGDFYAKLQYTLSECCTAGNVKIISSVNSQDNPALEQLQRRASEKLVEVTPRAVFERLLEDMTEEHRKELTDAFDEACRRLEEDDINAE